MWITTMILLFKKSPKLCAKSNSRYEQHPFALAYEAGNESLASTKNSSNSEIP